MSGKNLGAQPPLQAAGTEAADVWFSGFTDHDSTIEAGDFSTLTPSLGPPAENVANGVFVYQHVEGRSIAELTIVGTGNVGDSGRVQVFALNPDDSDTFNYLADQKAAAAAITTWAPRPLLDLTFQLGPITGVANAPNGIDGSTRYADTITIDSDHTWSQNAEVLCDDTGYIARVRFDMSGAERLVIVVTRDNGTGSSASSASSGSGTAGADTIGVRIQRG